MKRIVNIQVRKGIVYLTDKPDDVTVIIDDRDANVIEDHPADFESFGIRWQIQDVINEAENMDIELTFTEAEEILSDIESHADCGHGITWSTIQTGIKDYQRMKEEK